MFIYTGYSIVNSFFYWIGFNKPGFSNRSPWFLLLAILLDGWVVVAIDLFMDPIQVREGMWQWPDGGSYFGVPIGNFVGWFTVTIMVTAVFRTLEFFVLNRDPQYDKAIHIIPVIGYGLLALSFVVKTIQYNMDDLAVVGSLLMIPIALFNAVLFMKWKRQAPVNVS